MSEDIPLTQLKISDFNVRKHVGDVTELAQSLSEKGLLHPVLVRPENGKYGVIVGSRRYVAAKEAKLHKIPATIRQMNDEDALVVSLMENIQRNDLDPKETSGCVSMLINRYSHTQQLIAKKLGKSQKWVQNMAVLYTLGIILEKHDVKVTSDPNDKARDSGKAIPVNHAIHLANALDAPQVEKFLQTLPEKQAELRQVDLAKAIAPLKQLEAQKGLELLRKRPDASVDEIVDHATSLIFPAGIGGGGSILSSGTIGISEAVGREINGKLIWNLKRIDEKYDFYTIGYGYSEIDEFCDRLEIKGIKTLVDVRDNPTSLYKPEYDKENLKISLRKAGINYIHRPQLGVPKERRSTLATNEDYEKLWKWYDKNVMPKLNVINSDESANTLFDPLIGESKFNGPYAFMCRELDPTKCHRHRIAKGLETAGLTSLDL